MHAHAEISPASGKSVFRLANVVPLFPVMAVLLVVALIFLASERMSSQLATMLFSHVDRGLTMHSLIPFVCANVMIGTVGFTYGPGLIAGGFLFGFWGGICCCAIVEAITASSCFLVGRYVFRARCRAWYDNQAVPLQVKVAVGKFEKKELLNIILFRILPLPGCLKNYLPALLNVSFFSNLIAVLVEVLAYAPWISYLGAKSEGFARAYAQNHDMISGPAEIRATPEAWPALAISTGIFAVLSHLAAREFTEAKDGPDLSLEQGTVLSPLVDPSTLGTQMKPFREHQRL